MLGRAVAAQLERLQLGPHGPFVVDDVRDVLRGIGVSPRLQEPWPVSWRFWGMSGWHADLGAASATQGGSGDCPREPLESAKRERG